MSEIDELEPHTQADASGHGMEDAPESLVVVFDREGLAMAGIKAPDIVIEPEGFLADGSDLPIGRKLALWLQQHGDAPAVGIRFPKFSDGRGFSVAARLREGGYAGELHAMGAISQDLVFHLRRVGFTHFHLESPGIERIDRSVFEPFSGYYQAAPDGSRAYWQV